MFEFPFRVVRDVARLRNWLPPNDNTVNGISIGAQRFFSSNIQPKVVLNSRFNSSRSNEFRCF
jgi:hypothetical protein